MPSTETWRLGRSLEQRGVGLRGGEVDLVGEDDSVKIGPGRNSNSRVLRIEDRGARDVGRQEVGGALDPRDVAPSCRAIARASIVLATPGTSSRRTCPSGTSGDQDEHDPLALPEDDLSIVVEKPVRDLAHSREALFPTVLIGKKRLHRCPMI